MKNLAKDLIKIANKLDSMGLLTEANSLDKIAKRIVLSYSLIPHGDYKQDIENYKDINTLMQNETNETEKNRYRSDSTVFLNNIKSSNLYKPQQKEMFLLQAKSIRNEIYANLDGETLNNKLSNLLTFYRIIDENGKVLYSYEDLKNHWKNYIQKKFDIDNIYIARWLTNKFNMLVLKLKYQNPQPKSNTDSTNKKSETNEEKLARLFNFYRYKDENDKVLYTQEELKNHWVTYIQPQFNLNDKYTSNWLDSEYKKLIFQIKKQNAQK